MDKPQLNYNEYLRYTFAGGFGVLTYMYLSSKKPAYFFNDKGHIEDSLFLLMISLLLGSFLYAIHRAMLYPVCLRFNLVVLRLYGKINDSSKWSRFIFSQKLVMEQDFRRWKQRDNPKSYAKHLLDWSAQIHFLYCCVWAMLFSWAFTINEKSSSNDLLRSWWPVISIVVLGISIRNHYRSLLYDLELANQDKLNSADKPGDKVKTIELKVETKN